VNRRRYLASVDDEAIGGFPTCGGGIYAVTGDRTHFGALFGRRFRGSVVTLPVDAIGLLTG